MLIILIQSSCWWFLIGSFLPLICLSTIFCAKTKRLSDPKLPHKGTSSSIKKINNNDSSEKRNPSTSKAEVAASTKTNKSKTSKLKGLLKREPANKVHAAGAVTDGKGKPDSFEATATDGYDADDGGGIKVEATTQDQSKKHGGNVKLVQPNNDGYDDLIPTKNNEEAKSKMRQQQQNDEDGYENVDPAKNVNLENVELINNEDEKDPSPEKHRRHKPRNLSNHVKQHRHAKRTKKEKPDSLSLAQAGYDVGLHQQRRHRTKKYRRYRDEDDTLYEIGKEMPSVDFTEEFYESRKMPVTGGATSRALSSSQKNMNKA